MKIVCLCLTQTDYLLNVAIFFVHLFMNKIIMDSETICVYIMLIIDCVLTCLTGNHHIIITKTLMFIKKLHHIVTLNAFLHFLLNFFRFPI